MVFVHLSSFNTFFFFFFFFLCVCGGHDRWPGRGLLLNLVQGLLLPKERSTSLDLQGRLRWLAKKIKKKC